MSGAWAALRRSSPQPALLLVGLLLQLGVGATAVAQSDGVQTRGTQSVSAPSVSTQSVSTPASGPVAASAGQATRIALGRRMFYEGIGPDGHALEAHLSSDQRLSGSDAACVRCHRRSGQGNQEGRILIPPVTAATLFRDGVYAVHPGAPDERELARLVPPYQARHAYRDETLLRALEQGQDADGRPLADPMPRFTLDPAAREDLLAFLHGFGDNGTAMANPARLFWLVLTADADPRRSASVEAVVRRYVQSLQGQARWDLRVIDLHQDPAALRTALQDGSPRPLALLSGAGGEEWSAVADLCEREHLPCLFPSLLAPPADRDTAALYPQYLSAGLPLEARAAAHALQDQQRADCSQVEIVVEDGEETAAARPAAGSGLPASLPGVEASAYRSGLQALRAALPQARLVAAVNAAASARCQILWTGAERTRQLLEAAPPGPGQLRIVVQGLLPLDGFEPPAAWKPALEMVSGFDPEVRLRLRTGLLPWLREHGLEASGLDLRSAADAYAACYLTQLALSGIETERLSGMRIGPFSAEELIESLQDVSYRRRAPGVVLYSPIHLGEAQHTAARSAVVLTWESATAPWPKLLLRLPPM